MSNISTLCTDSQIRLILLGYRVSVLRAYEMSWRLFSELSEFSNRKLNGVHGLQKLFLHTLDLNSFRTLWNWKSNPVSVQELPDFSLYTVVNKKTCGLEIIAKYLFYQRFWQTYCIDRKVFSWIRIEASAYVRCLPIKQCMP